MAVPGLWYSHYLFPYGAGSDQVDKGFNDNAAILGGLSSQLRDGNDQHRTQIADLGRNMTRRFDGLEQVIAARKQPDPKPVPNTEAKPDHGQLAPIVGSSVAPLPMYRQLWRIDTTPTPGGKLVRVAFGVTGAEHRINALLLRQIGAELSNFGLTMQPADGTPADQYISFDATFGSGAGSAGCSRVKNLTLRGSFTGGIRPSGDMLQTMVEQCLDGQATLDDVKDQLVSIVARSAAARLAYRPVAQL